MPLSDFDAASFWPAIKQFVIDAGIEPISLGEGEAEVQGKIFAAMAASGAPLSLGMTPWEIRRAIVAALSAGVGVPDLPMIMRQVANRVSLPQEINASYPWGLAQTRHVLFAPVDGQVEVWWPNWRINVGGATFGGCSEGGSGAAATGTAQITYTHPVNGLTTVNLTDVVGGTTSLSAPDGGFFKAIATIQAAAFTPIVLQLRANFPNGVFYTLTKADLANGDRFQFDASVPALGTTPAQTFAETWYGPCLIRAMSMKPTAAIIGDSREDPHSDLPDTFRGDAGQFARLFGGAGIPYVNVSGRGETAADFAANTSNVRRRDILAAAGHTFGAIGLGTNDYLSAQNFTAEQIVANITLVAANLGVPTVLKTIDPYTQGDFVTPNDAFAEAKRISVNTTIRSRPVYFDVAQVLETSPLNSGGWISPDAVATDRLHERNTGNKAAAAQAALVGTSVAVHGIAARAVSVPATISDLAGSGPSQTSILLTFTATGAGHQYRLNGGAWTALPANRTISGLTVGTTYAVEVRGINGFGAGAASNVANIATQALPLTTWDPSAKSANIVLSEDNVRMTSNAAGNRAARGTALRTAGKLYSEYQKISGNGNYGLCTPSFTNFDIWVGSGGTSIGIGADGIVYRDGGNQGSAGLGTIAANDVVGMYEDYTLGKVWFTKNGAFGSGQNPLTNTGGWNMPLGGAGLYNAASLDGSGNAVRLRTETAQFSYAPLSGYSPRS